MRGWFWAIGPVMAALSAGQAGADPLWDMCHGPGHRGPEQCDCVVERIAAEFSGPDLALYQALAVRYIGAIAAGKAQPDAWDQALQRESAARGTNFATFSAHAGRLAIRHDEINRACAGG